MHMSVNSEAVRFLGAGRYRPRCSQQRLHAVGYIVEVVTLHETTNLVPQTPYGQFEVLSAARLRDIRALLPSALIISKSSSSKDRDSTSLGRKQNDALCHSLHVKPAEFSCAWGLAHEGHLEPAGNKPPSQYYTSRDVFFLLYHLSPSRTTGDEAMLGVGLVRTRFESRRSRGHFPPKRRPLKSRCHKFLPPTTNPSSQEISSTRLLPVLLLDPRGHVQTPRDRYQRGARYVEWLDCVGGDSVQDVGLVDAVGARNERDGRHEPEPNRGSISERGAKHLETLTIANDKGGREGDISFHDTRHEAFSREHYSTHDLAGDESQSASYEPWPEKYDVCQEVPGRKRCLKQRLLYRKSRAQRITLDQRGLSNPSSAHEDTQLLPTPIPVPSSMSFMTLPSTWQRVLSREMEAPFHGRLRYVKASL